MTREEKESLLREAVDILIKLDNHLMTSRDNAEFSQWVEDLIDNYCEEQEPKTGHWEWLTEDKYRCSNCNSETRVDECMNEPMYEFCPFCGAKMEGRK